MKEQYESGKEFVVEDIPGAVDSIVGAVADTEKGRADRKQTTVDKTRAEAKAIADLTPGPGSPGIWGGGSYKPTDQFGRVLQGPFGQTPLRPRLAQTNIKKPEPKPNDDDYLNQLMMAALMAGGKKGKIAGLGGAAGGGISFGDKWTMNAPWEKDYRYLNS